MKAQPLYYSHIVLYDRTKKLSYAGRMGSGITEFFIGLRIRGQSSGFCHCGGMYGLPAVASGACTGLVGL